MNPLILIGMSKVVTIPLLLARIVWQVHQGVYARVATPNDRAASPV